MKRKGFTLIELLAVIVILAIIALITVPMIMNVIEKAKKQALVDSAYGILEAGEYFYTQNIEEIENSTRYDFEVKNGKFVYTKDNTRELSFKGAVPKTGMLQINTNGKAAVAICDGTYCACKSVSDLQVTIKESNCNIDAETGEINDGVVKDGTPAGTVISYMVSDSAPDGYLVCDGSIYNISDYPTLANAIKDGMGTYNYYGGDGTTTFAVPDLRGEFLRGTGTSKYNTGSGSNVGVHQAPTLHANIYSSSSVDVIDYPSKGGAALNSNVDKLFGKSSNWASTTLRNTWANTVAPQYSSRPTNTSVLYCIKY